MPCNMDIYRERQTDRYTERRTDTQRDRQTHRHTETENILVGWIAFLSLVGGRVTRTDGHTGWMGHTHTHTHTHARTHAHTLRTHKHTHARTHARTRRIRSSVGSFASATYWFEHIRNMNTGFPKLCLHTLFTVQL